MRTLLTSCTTNIDRLACLGQSTLLGSVRRVGRATGNGLHFDILVLSNELGGSNDFVPRAYVLYL